MAESKSNIEYVARDICARQLVRVGIAPDDVQSVVDRYWHCVAAEIEAGLIDENGALVPQDYARGLEAYRDWRRRHPDCLIPELRRD